MAPISHDNNYRQFVKLQGQAVPQKLRNAVAVKLTVRPSRFLSAKSSRLGGSNMPPHVGILSKRQPPETIELQYVDISGGSIYFIPKKKSATLWPAASTNERAIAGISEFALSTSSKSMRLAFSGASRRTRLDRPINRPACPRVLCD